MATSSDTTTAGLYQTYIKPRTVNKIKWRNLDEELQGIILNPGKAEINIDNLFNNYVKKTDIINKANIDPTFIQQVDNIASDLSTFESTISDTYRAQAVPIDWSDLSLDGDISLDMRSGFATRSLGSSLIAICDFINHIQITADGNPVITFDENGYKQIRVMDSSGVTHLVTVPTWNNSTNNALDLSVLRTRVNEAESRIAALEDQLNAANLLISSLSNQLSSNTGIASITESSDTEKWKLSINSQLISLNNSLANKLSKDVMITESNLSQDVIDKLNRSSTTVSETAIPPVFTIDGTGYLYETDDGIITPRDVMITAYCCDNTEAVALAKTNLEEFIINTNNGKGSQRTSAVGAYQDNIDVVGSPDYRGMFVYDTKVNALNYYITDDAMLKINSLTITSDSGLAATTMKQQITIASKQYSTLISRAGNLNKVAPTVLVQDPNLTSGSSIKWVNSEGVISVIHEETGFKLLNDSNVSQICMVIYMP